MIDRQTKIILISIVVFVIAAIAYGIVKGNILLIIFVVSGVVIAVISGALESILWDKEPKESIIRWIKTKHSSKWRVKP